MKTKKLLIIVLFLANVSIAQVGIGNTSPEAILDITASNVVAPSANDGILIPRIDEFPAINPTALQDGIMVFVTGNGTPSKGFYYWDNATSAWLLVGGAKAINDLSDGKSDTDGTNDGSSIFLGINAGANDDGSNNRNIGIGWEALISNTTGNDNVAIGNNTLNSNISGFSNIGIGREVLYNNLGNGNIGIGFHALFGNTTGNDNMAIGFDAMSSNTTGISNTAMGSQALRLNTIGTRNNAYGRYALENNTDGIDNTATGYMALRNNT
ncbi:MAG: hypothetical protein KDC78_03420 [Aequorivita sp.]|nr:hypothetical protein [Aequorivita sp.]